MSQIFSTTSGSTPPTVATSYHTDFKADLVTPDGEAIPSMNRLNVLGGPGISTYADPNLGQNIFIKLENGCEETTTTTDAVPKDIICIALETFPSAAMVETRVVGFVTDTVNAGKGVSYFLTIGARTDGANAALIGVVDKLLFEDAALVGCDATFNVSGNNLVITVTGLPVTTMKWREVTTATIVGNTF